MFTRSKRKRRLAYLTTLSIIAIVIILIYLYTSYFQYIKLISTDGFTQVEVEKVFPIADSAVIQLSNGCSELSFYITLEQAVAIQQGLLNVTNFRPMTHDLLADILKGFEIHPLMVKITEGKENVYFAELVLQKWNEFLIADSRPSDAIAIATRTNTPIYVQNSLLKTVC
jgi:hypothetical protein